ncbi:hypothetical protein GPLA_0971 [Paraglaciecola polaris LMG 21857]|uniref:Uncharacterized protein n=1 Tax=Paraglaciecola polaris LMG 21857 TaxID=1129793 RepID=K6ZNM5_9ALTE|nr:hypothetical protein GPLA_0971 [Paraglaciecola polaris LMG 21857]
MFFRHSLLFKILIFNDLFFLSTGVLFALQSAFVFSLVAINQSYHSLG